MFLISAALIVFLDQLTKYIINQNIPPNSSIEVIPGVLFITHVRNSGVAFGLFPNKTNIFIIVSIIAVILIIILKAKLNISSVLYNISLGFVLGGAVGNLIDRFILGEVTDFINFVFWPVFNVADSFIVIGFCLLIFIIFKNRAACFKI
ncbi:MAG: signal peptidase II [Actinobacteria bacterium]|nr:signal peptidase II [Actinomycetota bacterium]